MLCADADDARRKFAGQWDHVTGGRDRNWLRSVISPEGASLPELQGALVRWEEQLRKYVNSQDGAGDDRTLPDDVRMAALGSLAPGNL